MPELLDIAVELVESIIDHLDPLDVSNFRLVSRAADDYAARAFKGIFLPSCRVLLCDPVNLHRTLALARHPKFGPCIRILFIFINYVSIPEKWGERVDEHGTSPKERGESPTSFEKKFMETQQRLIMTGDDEKALVHIFSALKVHGKLRGIGLNDATTDGEDCPPPVRMCKILDECEERVFVPDADDDRPFRIVMDSLAHTGLPIHNLRMFCNTWGLPMPLINGSEEKLRTMKKALHHTETLALRIADWEEADQLDGGHFSSPCIRTVAALPQLRVLQLFVEPNSCLHRSGLYSGRDLCECRPMHELFEAVMPNLEILMLNNSIIDFEELKKFVKRQPALRILELNGVLVRGFNVEELLEIQERYRVTDDMNEEETKQQVERKKQAMENKTTKFREEIGVVGSTDVLFSLTF
ncbi:Hypothetical predicted protein [Lecanosticta acicola]|uniref:F-box domain-containing protein n=1 Tax=Lecanosticta acicola TaxID=111012 RepID=A0AAI8VVC9_9PEZI|nr:Hypothetical predicted protein [Lecanosticta acicola]